MAIDCATFFKALSKNSHLEFLNLYDTELLLDDLKGIKELQQLQVLDLRASRNVNITREHIQEIQNSLPNTKVLN